MPEESNGSKPAKKSPLHITTRIDWDASNGTLTFDWKDGERTVLNLAELPVEQQTALMYWGCIARLQQGYVGARGSPEAARGKVEKVWQQLKAGEGLRRAENSSYSIVVKALAALLKIPDSDAQARWSALSPEKKKEVGARSDVLAAIANIKAKARQETESLAAVFE